MTTLHIWGPLLSSLYPPLCSNLTRILQDQILFAFEKWGKQILGRTFQSLEVEANECRARIQCKTWLAPNSVFSSAEGVSPSMMHVLWSSGLCLWAFTSVHFWENINCFGIPGAKWTEKNLTKQHAMFCMDFFYDCRAGVNFIIFMMMGLYEQMKRRSHISSPTKTGVTINDRFKHQWKINLQ